MNYEDIIERAFANRQKLFSDKENECFRLFNSFVDGIKGLTIDIYGEYLLIQFFHRELYDDQISIYNAITKNAASLPVNIKGILLKNRCRKHSPEDNNNYFSSKLIEGNLPIGEHQVIHNGIRVAVDLVKGQNTGLFLDMREVRNTLKSFYNSETDLLNLFCYTAVFAVHALVNGAKHAVNVDTSRTVLKRAKNNYKLNNISLDERDFMQWDVIKYLKFLARKDRKFNLIIFDPPTFSRNRKRTFSIKKDFQAVLDLLSQITQNAYILTAINSIRVSENTYMESHPKTWERIYFFNESSDFNPGVTPYLKAGLWRIKAPS